MRKRDNIQVLKIVTWAQNVLKRVYRLVFSSLKGVTYDIKLWILRDFISKVTPLIQDMGGWSKNYDIFLEWRIKIFYYKQNFLK